MSEMVWFAIVPGALDVVEFGGVFGQPLDGEPMGAVRRAAPSTAS